jgi:hypothetical protein
MQELFFVIDHRLRPIKHIQNEFFNGLDVIMPGDLYQTPPVKDCWVFSSLNDIVNALAPNFWKNNIKCYELTLVMQQTDTQFIKVLSKFCTWTQTLENIQCINSNCCQQVPNSLTTPHLFYINIIV